MKRVLVMLMIVGSIVGSVATAEAGHRSERTRRTVEFGYYGSHLLYQFGPCLASGGGGCVTVKTRAHERFLTARVSDAQGQAVPVRVVAASGPELNERFYGWFCGETRNPIPVDPGTELEFWVGGDWWPRWWVVPEFDCTPAPATTGRVTVTLFGDRPIRH